MIFWYSILLSIVSELPFIVGMSSGLYAVGALLLNVRFVWMAWRLLRAPDKGPARALFWFSIVYLFLLFVWMLCDHLYQLMG